MSGPQKKITLDITPVPKPRMTRSDKWKDRPCVLRYWAFCDELRLRLARDFELTGCSITFVLPVPKSWSAKRRAAAIGQPHRQKPDLSNLLKALEDAHTPDDSAIHRYAELSKVWGERGQVVIEA